ncbi:MAG: hypothetical protein HY235_01050 [Acidobacteria bacterium]|nr:hypothetical protein [Acidobacteriota bacterium]
MLRKRAGGWRRAGLFAAFVLAAPHAPAQPSKIEVRGLDRGKKPVILALEARGPECKERAFLSRLPGPNRIEAHCWKPDADGPRIAVFAEGKAVTYLDREQVWKRTEGHQLELELRPLTQLPVQIWLLSEKLRSEAQDQVAYANWVFGRNLAGFVLDAEMSTVPDPEAVPDSNEGDVDEQCSTAFALRSSLAPRPQAQIHVFYGKGVNLTCRKHPVVFIQENPALGVLAHEIGHAIGLTGSDGERDYDRGHTNNPKREHFDGGNTMWETSRLYYYHFSLGQMFWMNLSDRSILARHKKETCEIKDPLSCSSGQCLFFREDFEKDPRRPLNVPAGKRGGECTRSSVMDFFERLGDLLPGEWEDREARLSRLIEADNRPRYCSDGEIEKTLEGRFQQVCQAPGAGCGSSKEEFLVRWRQFDELRISDLITTFCKQAYDQRNPACARNASCRKELTDKRREMRELTKGLSTQFFNQKILWLDPKIKDPKVRYERMALKAMLRLTVRGRPPLFYNDYKAVISDSFTHLEAVRKRNKCIPYIVYPSNVKTKVKNVDATDDPFELFKKVLVALDPVLADQLTREANPNSK